MPSPSSVSVSDVITPTADGDQFQLAVPEGWRQGRGVYGGLCIGALVRAVEARVADPRRRVRSVTAALPGAVLPGRSAAIAVEELRRGNSLSAVRASLSQDGEVKSHAVAILAASRSAATRDPATSWSELPAPELPAWDTLSPVPPVGAFPEFIQHFELRPVTGLPGARATAALTLGWLRPRVPSAACDAGYVAALIDVWWPAAMVRLAAMPPMATIAFTLELLADPAQLAPDAPLIYRGVAPVCTDGYFAETRELWTADGTLLARNHQTFAMI